ncbi:MAG: ATP-binding protein [Candidatus Saccharimonadales bacterium]
MDIYTIIDGLIVISILLLAALSLMNNGYKNPTNRLFVGMSIFIAIWISAGDIGLLLNTTSYLPLLTQHIATFASSVTEIFMLLLVARLADIEKFSKLLRGLLPFFWIMAILASTPLVSESITMQDQGKDYIVNYGPLTWFYIATVTFGAFILIYGIILGLRFSDGARRRQIKIAGISLALTALFVILLALIIPIAFEYYELSNYNYFPLLFMSLGLYYSVIRYHLFDIRLAAVRTLAYALSLGILVGIYYGLAILISGLLATGDGSLISKNPINIILIFALLFIFQPIKRFFDKLTNRIFYRDYYDSDAFLDRLNRILTSTTSLRHLLQKAAFEIATTLKSEQAFFYLITHDGRYLTAGTPAHCQLAKNHIATIQSNNNYSKATSEHKNDIIISSMLDENNPLRHLMLEHKIEVILPLMHHGLLGYLFLGEHLTSHYTSRDIKVLSMIDDSLVIAIQNALSVESIRESNTELRQIDKIKDEFVSIASHELRTPMTIVRGYVSLLQRQQLGPQNNKQQAILNKISDNTKILIDLVNDMLDLSKLEANKLELNLGTYPIDDLIKKSIDQVELMYLAKGLQLTYFPTKQNNDANAGILVNVDPVHFDRIMLNLLSNAYKFTDKGSVTIKAALAKVEGKASDETDMVIVTITDTGIGISEDDMPTLFKKFSQVDNYLQRSTGGTGLGLSICQRLVTRLGGKIGVTSVPNKGSEFWFEVPKG